MRIPLTQLTDQFFDVVVIGAGLNGCSAAQHLAAAGYSVLIVDKGDFASGSSSRSSRMLSCGIRYLAAGESIWDFVRHPTHLTTALRMARQAMGTRHQFVATTPERVRRLTFAFPIYATDPYPPWQVRLAFKILEMLGPGDPPLDFQLLRPAEALRQPFLDWLRDPDKLLGAGMYREYQFHWPERVAVDTVLDAARMGAVVRNYTAVTGMVRTAGDGWRLTLGDSFTPTESTHVEARIVLNMAGIWIDRVNELGGSEIGRKITGTKGIHLAVRLPPECRDRGVMGINREQEHLYCFPWRDLHFFGPTETLYEGNIDDIHPTDDEIDWLVDEVQYLLPGAGFKRSDILFAWAGVRPLTYDPSLPKGARRRKIHDLGSDGMPNVLAMTAGPVMTHRSAGMELCRAVQRRLKPSGVPTPLSYAARKFPQNQNSPALLEHFTDVKLSDLCHAAEHELPVTLVDLLFRRVGAGWTETMAAEAAQKAAESVAEIMGWDDERTTREVEGYLAHLAHYHRAGPGDLPQPS